MGVFCFEASKWGMEQWPEREEPALKTKVITLDNGYGYQIFSADKLLIQQEFIPAVEGEKQFETKGRCKTGSGHGNAQNLERREPKNIPRRA